MVPPWLREIVAWAVDRHGVKAEAIAAAERKARRHAEYAGCLGEVFRSLVKGLVEDRRHAVAVAIKRDRGGYCKPPAGRPEDSAALAEADRQTRRRMRYPIGGTVLGELLGSQLEAIAAAEESAACGHLFNSKLCRRLRPLVPDDRKVGQVLTEQKLDKLFVELLGEKHC